MTQHELNSERLHVMVKPTTKAQLDQVSRYDKNFASEAEVVRHLLETFLPEMARVCTPRVVAEPVIQDDPVGELRPQRFNGGRPASVRREDLETLGVRAPLVPPKPPWMPPPGSRWGYPNDAEHRDAPLEYRDGVE